MAAPGSPKIVSVPSFSRMAMAASMARMVGMVPASVAGAGGGRVRVLTGLAKDTAQQGGVVQSAVAVGHCGTHQLGQDRAERDDHAGLPGRGGDNAHVLVVQVDPEARFEVAVEHVLTFLVQDGAACQAAAEDLERGL